MTTINGVTFNENEFAVLKALYNAEMDATAGDFGFLDEVDRCGMKKQQFAGYISALKEKSVFEYLDSEGFYTNGMMKIVGQYHLDNAYHEFFAKG